MPRLRPLFVLALLLALTAPSFAADRPSMPTLTEKQTERLHSGKLVLLTDKQGDDKTFVTGVIQIDAPPSKIWEIALSEEHIVAASKAVKEATTYHDQTSGSVRDLRLAFMLKVGWTEIRYHSQREVHASEQYMVWSLDDAKTNDIKSTEGSYSTWPGPTPDKTLFLYKARIETGKKVPDWLEEELTESSLKKYLVYIKQTAEE